MARRAPSLLPRAPLRRLALPSLALLRRLALPWLALLPLSLLAACGGAGPGAPFWRPYYDPPPPPASDPPPPPVTTGPDLGGATTTGDGGTPAHGPCALAVSVTTASPGGTYSPNNIGAIWITDGAGAFVKTLRVWADRRIEHLERWAWVTSLAGAPDNVVDAVTSASMTSHGTRTAAWSCTDIAGKPVADGSYQVCFELTDANAAGPYSCVPFAKGPMPVDLSPADLPTFKQQRIQFTP